MRIQPSGSAVRAWAVVSRLFTGALAANGIPHFVQGVSGHLFSTPFASPPGVGLSSPVVNVLWGSANFAIAYVLLAKTRPIASRFSADVWALGLGFVATAAALAVYFG